MGEKNIELQKELRQKKELWRQGGGADKIEKLQHNKGKLSARERIDLLFDPGTFVEYGLFAKADSTLHGIDKLHIPGDGVIIGFGKVDGRIVWAISEDFTVLGGSIGQNHAMKIARAGEEAARNGCPIVYFWDGGGGRIQEAHSRDIIKITMIAAKNSGYIPSVSVIMGSCAGGSAYAPILNDYMITVDKTSKFFLCGPSVIESATGEKVDAEELAGGWTENNISGNAHQLAKDDADAIWHVKKYLSYMPQNCEERVPIVPYEDDPNRLIYELDSIVPDDTREVYDCHEVLELVADKDSLYEYQPDWAPNIVCCFGRIMGETVGLIANQTTYLGGCFDINASDKYSRFVDILDCYNIPMITFTDTPGFLPGIDQEHGGIIRHGAKTLEANYRVTVPKIQVVLRKQIGGAGLPMGLFLYFLDLNLYWPTYDFGIMDPRAACEIILAKEIKAHPEQKEALLAAAIEEFVNARTPYEMCAHMWADDVIEPNETRMRLIQALAMLRNKNPDMIPIPNRKRKHPVSPR